MNKSDWQFVLTPDEMGLGRIIVDGKYYGIPLSVAQYLSAIKQQEPVAWRSKHNEEKQKEWFYSTTDPTPIQPDAGGVVESLYLHPAPIPEGWQPIDTVPKDDTPVLVYLADKHLNSHMHVAMYHPNIVTIAGSFSFDCPTVTHWRPLPDAPKPGDKP